MSALLESPTTDDLTAMSPAQFVELLREQLRQSGGGMHNHPIIEAMEAGTATKEQLALFGAQFYLHISKMLPWIGLMYVTDAVGRKQVFDCTVETGKMFFELWNVYKLV